MHCGTDYTVQTICREENGEFSSTDDWGGDVYFPSAEGLIAFLRGNFKEITGIKLIDAEAERKKLVAEKIQQDHIVDKCLAERLEEIRGYGFEQCVKRCATCGAVSWVGAGHGEVVDSCNITACQKLARKLIRKLAKKQHKEHKVK